MLKIIKFSFTSFVEDISSKKTLIENERLKVGLHVMKKVLILSVLSLMLIQNAFAQALASAEFEKAMEGYLANEKNVEKVGEALENYFRKKQEDRQQQQAKAEQEEMESQFKNPVKVDVGSSPVKGNPNAKITVVEFSDFQCPFCKRGMEVMYDLLKEYPNDVKVSFKNLPLPFHPQAKPAAIASLAAKQQGKFWEMHDELFANQERLGDELYVELAGKLGLDVEKFKKDLLDPKIAAEVEQDAALATKLGVSGTPGFFVNGVQVKGARPLPYFKEIVERWKKQG